MSATEMSIQHGEIFFLHELGSLPLPPQEKYERSVRVVGRCIKINTQQRRIVLQDRASTLTVDIELISDQYFVMDGLYQVIGELREGSEREGEEVGGNGRRLLLRARVARAVDGMDISLYEQSVRLRRAFLEKHKMVGKQERVRNGAGEEW
ncbi:hypothetical protein VYU27_001907 [Nannochloropsis oceanica]